MKFPVVTLCGSMRYYLDMIRYAEMMTTQGIIVLMPHSTAWDDKGTVTKRMLDEMHFQKIDMSDAIAVVGVHRGTSTAAEINYATENGKAVAYMVQPADSRAVTELVAALTDWLATVEPKPVTP